MLASNTVVCTVNFSERLEFSQYSETFWHYVTTIYEKIILLLLPSLLFILIKIVKSSKQTPFICIIFKIYSHYLILHLCPNHFFLSVGYAPWSTSQFTIKLESYILFHNYFIVVNPWLFFLTWYKSWKSLYLIVDWVAKLESRSM